MAFPRLSSTSRPKPHLTYDVFLSFRGADTRYKFTDHLYRTLEEKKITTFKDDKEIQMGEPISQELLDAIKKSSIAVIVFSENYANSSWCLEELAEIVECRERGILRVLPIFYHVEPTDVRHQGNAFKAAFDGHEKRFPEKVQKWKAALTNVAGLSGQTLKDGESEAEFLRRIVHWICSELNDKRSNNIEGGLVGIGSRVEKLKSYLDLNSTDVLFIGISGISGMGKSTLARVVFNRIRDQFDASSFLEIFGEDIHCLVTLQERLLWDICKKKYRVRDADNGFQLISNNLRNRKVLIIVDNVSKQETLERLIGKPDLFGPSSRIIVTTKERDFLADYGITRVSKAEGLDNDEALQLFSLKAFHTPHCESDFQKLCIDFVNYAQGLPLVLEVLGSYLHKITKMDWESVWNQLKAIPEKETTKKLKLALNGLSSNERALFLDIACFFNGEDQNRVVDILESVNCSDIITNLINKSLITIVEGKLWMHNLLQQMGWEIVSEQSGEPERLSRLWLHSDVFDVLKNNTGTDKIEGMVLLTPNEEEGLNEEEVEELNAESFTNMNKLRLLKIICKVRLSCLRNLSNELQLLEWHYYPLKSLPKSFQPDNLVELILHCSRIQKFPREFRNLLKLKLIDLSGSKNLTQTPDFNEFPNIERLNFQGCTRLHELHPSVGGLKRLVQLNLKDCIYLKNLPHELNLNSLQTLILSGCSILKKFPQIGRNMTSLSKLYLDGTAIEELPLSMKRLTGLTLLNLRGCKNLLSFPKVICSLTSLRILTLSSCEGQPPKQALSFTYLRSLICSTLVLWRYCFFIPEPKPTSLLLPKSFSGLSSLVSLDLSDCNLLDGALPDDLRCLSSLKSLNMSKNNFTLLHDDISLLAKLKLLYLDHCSKLQSLPHLPLSTQFVSARGCTSLENCSNQVVVWTSGEARFTIISCLGLADDDGKIAEVSSLDIHFQPLWLWQRYVEDQIHQIEGFCHVLRQTEIPKWFGCQNFGSFAPIPLPSNLFSNRSWEGIALCVIFIAPNSNDGSPGQDSKYFHEFFCRLVVNGDLIAFKVPKETYGGSFGLWLYISNARFRQHLNERNSISPSIEVNSPDIKIELCGARILLYKQDMVEFVQNLRQITFDSPNFRQGHEKFKEDNMSVSQSSDQKLQSLLSGLYQEDWARTHLYDYIFPQIAYSPTWFTNENWGPSIRFPLPRDYHDDSSWLGFSIHALYTIQMQRDGINYKQDSTIFLSFSSFSASDDVYFAPYTAFPLSRDIFDEPSQRLVVFYIPRLLFQLNRCSHIKASFGSDDSSVQVEKCGIRLVHKQDVSEFVQTLVQYMLRSSDAYLQYFSSNLMHQLRVLKDCNHEKDYCCHIFQERWSNPMPKLLLSNGTIQEECTSRETLFSNHAIAAGTSNNSSRGSNYLGIPFVNGHGGSEISSCLECWYRPYLQHHYSVRSTSYHRFSQSEIPEWFKYRSINRSVKISLPLNLYDNPDWKGFAFCAVFSFQKHPASVPMKLHSRFSFVIVCHLKTNLGCMNPLLWYGISEEDVIISLHQREFLWVSFIPCEFLSPEWSRCNSVEFSFVSDNSDVLALKCGVDLVYGEELEFTRTMVQCITSYDRPSTSYERFPFNHPNQFRSSDGSSGTSGHYPYEWPYQFCKTAALDRCNNRSIFNQCIPQSEIVELFSHDLLPSDLSPKFDFHPSTSYNFCFPPSKIQDWFSHPNHGHSMTIDLPSNLYHNRNWMGLVLYASFSIHGDPNIIFSNLVSGKSHFLYCQCQTSMGNVDNQTIAFSTNKEEITWLLNLGEFIWICYVPGEPFKNMLPHCTHIEASFVSDWPGVIVQNCALQLLYQHDQVQFEQELKHCKNLISQKRELVCKQLEDQKKINEQYHVDEGLHRIIFSNIDFEVKIFPRLIDQLETDETETQLSQNDLLENQEKVDKWSVTTKEVTKISGEHLEKSQQIISMVVLTDKGASSSSTHRWDHDIFLSFRGADTRNNFTGHLYKALDDHGFNTFFIDDHLQKGEEISMDLVKAIESSMISIVIFSKNFASSTWCLNELVKIFECRSNGQLVFPIFYKVSPSEIRKQDGEFGIALAEHEEKFEDDIEKVQRWRTTLTRAANLSGFHYNDREIVQQESKELQQRSRIWRYKDAHTLLTRNMGSNKIRGIMLCSPEPAKIALEANVFKRMKNLKFLIGNVHIGEALDYLPDELRVLEWCEFPLSLSSKCCLPRQLVVLKMSESNIILENVVKQGFEYENLKMISLRSCEFITKLPGLCCPNLEILDLYDCKNLIEVHESVGLLEKLKEWDLAGCSQLQILPRTLMLKSLKYFKLVNCSRLEKFPDIHPEMNCLRELDLTFSGIRELPSSLLYLTGLVWFDINIGEHCELMNFLVGTNKSQMQEEEDIPSAKLRLPCNSFNNFSGPAGFLCLRSLSLCGCHRIKGGLDSWMQPDYFPVLEHLNLSYTGIVTIPESISRFTTLQILRIKDCKKLRKIPRLPQSIRTVDAENCYRLDTQSSSRLLNQFGEILGILPNTIAQAATSFRYGSRDYLLLPAIEIPKWFEFNHHQSVGNYVSFLVGPKFSDLAVCIAIPSKDIECTLSVHFFINGIEEFERVLWLAKGNYDHVWLMYWEVDISNPSEENLIEVKVTPRFSVRMWIFGECICCLQKPNISPASSVDQCAFNNGEEDSGRVGIRRRLQRRSHRPRPILLHRLNPTLKRR